ncbi:MAG: hypothetical protein E7416_01725 [Ruminococcaceae bacterium]|nr:hypothetical protein [Oscillospiraceae bacterium]
MKRFLSLLLTVAMVFSCMSITALADDAVTFELFGSTNNATSTYAHAGSKVLATAVDGADYYKNGEAITPDSGLAQGTVALPITAGVNHFTAVVGGTTYGPISVYGLSFAYVDKVIGANLSSASYFNLAAAAEPVGGRTAYIVGSGTGVHQFTSGMNGATRYHVGHGYAFYMAAAPTTNFVIMNLKNEDNTVNFELFVEAGKTDLKFKDWTGETFDTGYDITPGQWYELNTDKVIANGGMLNVYLNRQLVARADIINPASAMPATLYTNAPTGDGTNTYVADLASFSDILTSTRRASHTGVCISNSTALANNSCAFYIQRNGDYVNRPSMTAEASDGAVIVTETAMSEFAAYTNRAVYVNGQPAADLGITATNEGNTFTFVSSTAYPEAEVTVYVTDADGNFVNGMYGPLKATATVDIVGNGSGEGGEGGEGGEEGGDDEEVYFETFELYDSTNNATSTYAHAGSKVIITALENATYYKNGTQVNPVKGPVAGTRLFDITAGSNIFTAEVGGVEVGRVAIYGIQLVRAASSSDLGSDVVGKLGGTEITEGAPIDGTPHPFAYKIEDEYSSTFAGTNVGFDGWVRSMNSASRNHVSLSYGFYIDGTLTSDFYVLDIRSAYKSSSTATPTSQNNNYGTLSVRVDTNNQLVVANKSDVVETGIILESGRWYNLSMGANYVKNGIANIYIDGILVAKITFLPNNATGTSGPAVMKASGGGGNGYIGNATATVTALDFPGYTDTAHTASKATYMFADRNQKLVYPTAPTIAEATEDNTITVTTTLPTELTGYETKVFVNNEIAETVPNGDNLVIVSDSIVNGASVYAAIVDANNNVVTGMYGDLLKSAEIPMNLVVSDGQPTISLAGNTVTIKREALGEDAEAELAVVSVNVNGVPTIERIIAPTNTATVPNNAVKVFVWVWETLKPLVAPFIVSVN